jgi:hypothetical protein
MFETEMEMTIEQAHEIVSEYNYWQDYSCSCHNSPPCSKCTDCPSEEDYKIACELLTNAGEM